jgi:hypothetical protein
VLFTGLFQSTTSYTSIISSPVKNNILGTRRRLVHITTFHGPINLRRKYPLLSQSDDSDNQAKLILGDDLSKGIAGLGSEQGYLAAAKKRAEEYARKRSQQVDHENEVVKPKHEKAASNNYGPGELSAWRGFANDGFEASAGNDGEDGWEVKEGIILTLDSNQKTKSPPPETLATDGKLFLFDNDNDGKLIL